MIILIGMGDPFSGIQFKRTQVSLASQRWPERPKSSPALDRGNAVRNGGRCLPRAASSSGNGLQNGKLMTNNLADCLFNLI